MGTVGDGTVPLADAGAYLAAAGGEAKDPPVAGVFAVLPLVVEE